jgi:hypothetical protein
LATGVASGSITIAIGSGSITGSATLTVNGGVPVLTSLTIFPVNPTSEVGATEQFTAIGNYSDGSTQVLTSIARWTTSNSTIASMQAGVATGVNIGSATITATYNGFTINTTLTVVAQTLFNTTALMDMPQANGGCLTYLSFSGGLYENCSDDVPSDHSADGLNFVSQIQPLDTTGIASPNGKIVFVSTGHSVAATDFGAFVTTAQVSSAVNTKTMALSNSALSNMTACYWFPAYGPPNCDSSEQNNYDRIAANMASRGISPLQVQVMWTENNNGRTHANSRGCLPTGTLCVPLCDPTSTSCTNTATNTDALNVEWELGNTMRAAKVRWPNLKLAFFTSRNYGGYAPAGGSDPEPYAFEAGLAVKWLIQAQINQMRTGVIDPIAGDLNYNNGTAPWIAWGPYFWADGSIPRSDDLVWCFGSATSGPPCNGEQDYQPDGQHPSGETKQVNMLMNFFLNSPYTHPWFAAN